MAGSVNKVILVGNLGKDPEVRRMTSGEPVVNLSVATSETWRDKASGEKKEKTEWHRVVIFNENLAKVAEQYLRKGAKVYLEGALQTRKWQDKDGQDKYSTEIVLNRFNGTMVMLDGRSGGGEGAYSGGGRAGAGASEAPASFQRDEMDDEILFGSRVRTGNLRASLCSPAAAALAPGRRFQCLMLGSPWAWPVALRRLAFRLLGFPSRILPPPICRSRGALIWGWIAPRARRW